MPATWPSRWWRWTLGCRCAVRDGERSIEIRDLHRLPGADPSVDTTLRPGEIITEIVAARRMSSPRASAYIKVRDRATFEWPVVSAAVGLDMDGPTVRPPASRRAAWDQTLASAAVEKALAGQRTLDAVSAAAANLSIEGATAHRQNAFKLKLLPRVVERAILTAGGQA